MHILTHTHTHTDRQTDRQQEVPGSVRALREVDVLRVL